MFGDTFGLSKLLRTLKIPDDNPLLPPPPPTSPVPGPYLCVFCKNNNFEESAYRSHALKDSYGRILCPYLRAYTCPICKANGDNSHTLKYCPMNQNPGLFPRPERKQQQQQQQPIHRPGFRPFPPPPRLPNMSMGNQFPNFQRNENSLFFNN